MRICLVSNYNGITDEGMKKIAFYLHKELSQQHKVLHLSLKDIASSSFWRGARNFQPQLIQYVPGPSLWSFMITKALALWCGGAKTVMSAPLPSLSLASMKFIPLLKPDLILAHSRETENLFSRLGCKVAFFPLGVDVERFSPLPDKLKQSLRQKYGLSKSKFILLHIGPVVRGRGLEILSGLNEGNIQVLIIVSTATKIDHRLQNELISAGCLVWNAYFSQIEEVYQLSDGYIFPTPNSSHHAVQIPLSVLEAMSCNLPGILSQFGGLPQLFSAGDGLIFAQSNEDFHRGLNSIIQGIIINTRDKVSPYSWQMVTRRLGEIYEDVLSGGSR